MYATDAGLNFLDVIDFYINFVMLIVGCFECFAAGWVYGIEKTIAKCGPLAFGTYLVANFGAVFLACGIWFGADSAWGGFVAMILWYLVFLVISLFFLKQHIQSLQEPMSFGQAVWALSFENIFDLKARIEPVTQHIPGIWCFLIKQFLPHLLIVLFVNLAQSQTSTGEAIFGNYGGYVTKPFQVMGILTFVLTVFVFSIGFAFPQVYEPLALPPGHLALDPDSMVVNKNGASDPTETKTKNIPGEEQSDEEAKAVQDDGDAKPVDDMSGGGEVELQA